jgi:hypothetical protein
LNSDLAVEPNALEIAKAAIKAIAVAAMTKICGPAKSI